MPTAPKPSNAAPKKISDAWRRKAEAVKELTALVESGEQNNEAFAQFEKHTGKIKAIGRVSLDNEMAKKIHADFNHQLDLYRHNRKIALDLLELDYAKNLAVKEYLLAKLEHLYRGR